MRSFTKISDKPIGDRSAVQKAGIVVYLDDTLFTDDFVDELADGGVALLNTTRNIEDEQVITIDASGLSAKILGRPIPNTTFLGAIAAISDVVSIEDIEEGIRQTMPPKLHERNIEVVRAAYEQIKGHLS